MTAAVVVIKQGGTSRVIPCPTAHHARAEARGYVLGQDESVRTVTVCDGGREVERWVRDERTHQWRHLQGYVIGSRW